MHVPWRLQGLRVLNFLDKKQHRYKLNILSQNVLFELAVSCSCLI